MTDYMATEHEIKKQPQALDGMLAMATLPGQTKPNPEVFAAMWSFWNFAHVFDDLIDGSNWPAEKKEQAMKALHDWINALLCNPFVTANANELRGVFVSCMTRCLDGDRMESEAQSKRDVEGCARASVVRCGDIDVLMTMTYLLGGWEHMRKFSPLRDYDKPEPLTPEPKE